MMIYEKAMTYAYFAIVRKLPYLQNSTNSALPLWEYIETMSEYMYHPDIINVHLE